MTKRFSFLIAFVAAFLFTAPLALAAPPDAGTAPAAAAADDAKADAPEAKAEDKPEAKAEEAGTESGGDTDGADTEGTDTDGASEDLGEHVDAAVSAARSGEWALMVSAIIMLLLGAGRKFGVMDKVPSNAVPWVSVVLGVIAVVGDSLASGGEITMERVLAGVMAGAAASGLWGMLGKHILGAKKAE